MPRVVAERFEAREEFLAIPRHGDERLETPSTRYDRGPGSLHDQPVDQLPRGDECELSACQREVSLIEEEDKGGARSRHLRRGDGRRDLRGVVLLRRTSWRRLVGAKGVDDQSLDFVLADVEREVLRRDGPDGGWVALDRDVELDQSLLDLFRERRRLRGLIGRGACHGPDHNRDSEQLLDPHERCAPLVEECTA